jgi:hypothetical protein
VIVYLCVRRIHSGADIRRLQDQVYEDFKLKHMRTLIYSFVSNEANVLEYIVSIYFFSIYSVVVVLHACVNKCAPMIQLTRLDLSFLEALVLE